MNIGVLGQMRKALALLLVCAFGSPALAEFDALKGQTIRFVIAAPAGTSTDRTGRQFVAALGKLVPDATIRVQNLGEAAGGVGIVEIQNATGNVVTFGMVNSGVVYAQLASHAAGMFDLGKMRWLGAIGGNLKVLVIRKGLGPPVLDTLAKLGRQPLIAVTGGAGTAGNTEGLMINAVGPVRMKIVGDLEEALVSSMLLAGDLDGAMRSYATIKPLIDSGDVVPILLYTRDGMPAAFAGIPTLADVIQPGKADEVVHLISEMPSRMFMAAPATKPSQLADLNAVFTAIVSDPTFQAGLAVEDRAVRFTAGDDLERRLKRYFDPSSGFAALVQRLVECGQRISAAAGPACQ